MDDTDITEDVDMSIKDFMAMLDESGAGLASDYFRCVLIDHNEDGNTFTDSDRHFKINDVDISSVIDLAIVFGIVWSQQSEIELTQNN